MNYFLNLLSQHGYIVLGSTLLLELMAFPMPGELLMMYCGFLIYSHKLNWGVSVLVAAAGTIAGITLSYFIGRLLEESFFEKHGHYVHLGPEKIEKVSAWFKRYGNTLLIAAFFIPGVRHVTGYFSGVTKISYKKFGVYSYSGAALWTITFISLGNFLGPEWDKYHKLMSRYFIIGGSIAAAAIIILYYYNKNKLQIIEFTMNLLNNGLTIFRSMGKVKIAIIGISVVFLGLSAFVVNLVDSYLENEFKQFDEVIRYLSNRIFDENASSFMNIIKNFASNYSFILIISLTVLWIALKGKDKLLEIRFTLIGGGGALIFSKALTALFHRTGPLGSLMEGNNKYTFPSGEALMSVVIYGFFSYLLLRHSKRILSNTVYFLAPFIICFLIGLSLIYLNIQYPSDVLAGFVFGGMLLSLNIILMEVYRVIPKLNAV